LIIHGLPARSGVALNVQTMLVVLLAKRKLLAKSNRYEDLAMKTTTGKGDIRSYCAVNYGACSTVSLERKTGHLAGLSVDGANSFWLIALC
jgi:hypothetical protein